ncbi:MAG TPA: hypothetical protein VFV50_06765 [Bdellovibrionales bacterium]|nr:hypothetical protein [Bdellovibrionales bacterium]
MNKSYASLLVSSLLALSACQKSSSTDNGYPQQPPVNPYNVTDVPVREVRLDFPQYGDPDAINLAQLPPGSYVLSDVQVFTRNRRAGYRAGAELSLSRPGMPEAGGFVRKGAEFATPPQESITMVNVPNSFTAALGPNQLTPVYFDQQQRLFSAQISSSGLARVDLAQAPSPQAQNLSWLFDRRYQYRRGGASWSYERGGVQARLQIGPGLSRGTHYQWRDGSFIINGTATFDGNNVALHFWYRQLDTETFVKLTYAPNGAKPLPARQ